MTWLFSEAQVGRCSSMAASTSGTKLRMQRLKRRVLQGETALGGDVHHEQRLARERAERGALTRKRLHWNLIDGHAPTLPVLAAMRAEAQTEHSVTRGVTILTKGNTRLGDIIADQELIFAEH
jgi:hypothetical protein